MPDGWMIIVIFQLVGVVIFFAASVRLHQMLRRNPSPTTARRTSVASHILFHLTLAMPVMTGIFYPGLYSFDRLLGWPSFPESMACRVTGLVTVSAGILMFFAAHGLLTLRGRGLPSFLPPGTMVVEGVYRRVRHPLALGWYLCNLGLAWFAGSTYLTLYLIILHIPAHIFYLRYFEELELTVRFGESYTQYTRCVPFLIPIGRNLSQRPSVQ